VELLIAADYFDHHGSVVRPSPATRSTRAGPRNLTYTRHEPYGVVAVAD